MLKQFGVSANETYQLDFLKIANLNCLRKEQRPAPFVEHSVHSPLSALKGEQKWNCLANYWNL